MSTDIPDIPDISGSAIMMTSTEVTSANCQQTSVWISYIPISLLWGILKFRIMVICAAMSGTRNTMKKSHPYKKKLISKSINNRSCRDKDDILFLGFSLNQPFGWFILRVRPLCLLAMQFSLNCFSMPLVGQHRLDAGPWLAAGAWLAVRAWRDPSPDPKYRFKIKETQRSEYY